MELKDGVLILTDEEKKMLGSNEGKKWLTDNKFMIETVKEVDKPLTAEAVTNFISKNQSLSDKLYNDNAIKFLKSKLGDKVTSDDLGKEIVFKNSFDDYKKEAIKTAVSFGLGAIFNDKGSQTPPPLPPNNGNSKVKYEDFLKMSDLEKAKLTDEQLKEILREK